jgi:hypothetical protein
MRHLSPLALLLVAGSASALPNPDTRFRPGANHHLGDDSFVAAHGRAPTEADTEKARMKVHLEHVRGLLAARPATEPTLAARRSELLGYLDDYIAKGITPKNHALPWRSAVFIDEGGAICAVGYLIERSAGRALPEKIASLHRYDFLEDIAAAMPEVDAWIRSSGFTLEELASIQPAYSSPNVKQWRTWDLVKHAPADGPFAGESYRHETKVTGTFHKKSLHGTWKVTSKDNVVVGTGDLAHGTGAWRSFYPDGKSKLAEGSYVNNVAHGAWTLYHPSGNLAATGSFTRGMRTGAWSFYNDTPDRKLLAAGAFDAQGSVTGTWRHHDADGNLLATTWAESGSRIDVVPNADGVAHQIHQWSYTGVGPSEWYTQELERFTLGGEQIYVHTTAFRSLPTKDERFEDAKDPTVVYDAGGHKLVRAITGWTSADCHWSKKRIAVAKQGELAWLHQMLFSEVEKEAVTVRREPEYTMRDINGIAAPVCDAPVTVPAARAAVLDKLIAPREAMRSVAPTFVREMVLNSSPWGMKVSDEEVEGEDEWVRETRQAASDLRRMLSAYTLRYVEWPHIDGRFDRLFGTMAGRLAWEWAGSEPEADGSSPLENERIEEERRKRGER